MNLIPNATLKTLIEALGDVKKAEKTPTSKKLREEAGEPIITTDSILIYPCGYAVYENESGRTVMWVPGCTSFTYYFNKTTDAEKDILPETAMLPEGMLEELPWEMVLTLIGDHRIEANSMNRTASRKNTVDFDVLCYGDKDGDVEEAIERTYRKEYEWREDCVGESPETVYLRKEGRKEALRAMTMKQREVFNLYYREGYRQREIAEMLQIGQRAVSDRLVGALQKVRRFCC